MKIIIQHKNVITKMTFKYHLDFCFVLNPLSGINNIHRMV